MLFKNYRITRLERRIASLLVKLTEAEEAEREAFRKYQEVYAAQRGYTRKQVGYFTELDWDTWMAKLVYKNYLQRKWQRFTKRLERLKLS